ncbi:MAG TPA: hypothetical protein VNT30_10040 [Stellaceae bacterium]|nr:hypothetical protein [Stellaceae bacterium]
MKWTRTFVACSLVLSITLPAHADDLRVTASVFGNVFTRGEPIVFDAGSTAWHLTWRLADLDGHGVAEGGALPRNGHALLYLPSLATGYYRLRVTAVGDGAGDGAAVSEQALAVVSGRDGAPADARFDVVTHFALGWKPDILPLIARAGIAGLRDELPWAAIETEPGRFAVPRPLEDYVTAAHRLHIDVLTPLTYGNPLYDGGDTPHTPEGIAAYARYAGEIVRHFGDRLGAVEIWNEYNGAFAGGAVLADRPRFYADMLKATFARVKAARREMTVVAGGVAGVPVPYFRRLVDRQSLADLDVVQIHPYYDVPEDAEYDVSALQRLLAQHSRSRPVPIWATEIGSYDQHDRRRTAERLVRLSTVLLAQGVGRIYWYLLLDTPDFPMSGLLENTGNPAAPYAPTPAYASYAALIRELRDARFHNREPGDARTRIYRFDGPHGQVRIAWSEAGTTELRLRTAGPLTIVRLDGREVPTQPIGDTVALDLTSEPIFIRGPIAGITGRRGDQVIADSATDFADHQGAGNWFYGSATASGFREARWSGNDWGDFWADPQLPFLSIERLAMQPSLEDDGQPVPAIRRWRSPYQGAATLSVTMERGADQGDGVHAEIRLDGELLREAELGTPGHEKRLDIAIPIALRKGAILDVAVSPASSRLDFDNTAVRIRITAPARNPAHG